MQIFNYVHVNPRYNLSEFKLWTAQRHDLPVFETCFFNRWHASAHEFLLYRSGMTIPSFVRTMARLGNRSLALLSFLIGALFVWSARATHPQSSLRPSKRLEAAKRWEYSARTRNGESHPRRSGESGAAPPRVQNITFTNPKAEGASQGPRPWVHYSRAPPPVCLMCF